MVVVGDVDHRTPLFDLFDDVAIGEVFQMMGQSRGGDAELLLNVARG